MNATPVPAPIARLDQTSKAAIVVLILLTLLPSLLTGSSRWLTDLVMHLPIAVFLLTLRPTAPRRYAWLCFVVLAYFCSTVLDAFLLPSLRGYTGLAACLTTIVIFTASMIASRKAEHWMQEQQQQNA